MPPRRVKRKGGRQRFYARNVLIAFSSEVDTGSREENASKQESRQRLTAVFGRLMHSFPAGSANSPYTTRIHPALASFVGEVCGTLARLCAYLMTLALMAIGGIALWQHLPEVTAMETSPKTWSQAGRTAPAFAVSQFIFPGKTETYEIFRHPWLAAARSAVLNRLTVLSAGNDPKLAELFARAELRRGDCAAPSKCHTAPRYWFS